MSLADVQGLSPVARFQHTVALRIKKFSVRGSKCWFVLHHQNCLRPSSYGTLFCRARRFSFHRRLSKRQIYLKSSSFPQFAVYPYHSVALLYDPVNRSQPQTSTLSRFFGRKERFKDSYLRFGVHSKSVVTDR